MDAITLARGTKEIFYFVLFQIIAYQNVKNVEFYFYIIFPI